MCEAAHTQALGVPPSPDQACPPPSGSALEESTIQVMKLLCYEFQEMHPVVLRLFKENVDPMVERLCDRMDEVCVWGGRLEGGEGGEGGRCTLSCRGCSRTAMPVVLRQHRPSSTPPLPHPL